MAGRPPRLIRAALAVSGLIILLFLGRALTGIGGIRAEVLFATHGYDLAKGLAVAVLLARAARSGPDRAPWALMGIGLAMTMIGDVLWSRLYDHGGEVPIPSICDFFYVGAYVPLIAASLVFLRSSVHGMRSGLWVDGLISALAVATVFAAVIMEPIGRSLEGEHNDLIFVTQVAYPVADLLLVGAFVSACALGGWRLSGRWMALVAGAVVYVLTDGFYLLYVLEDRYVAGGIVDSGWLIAAWIWSAVAWSDTREFLPAAAADERPRPLTVFAPIVFGTLAGVLGFVEAVEPEPSLLTLVVAFSALLAVFVRFGLTSLDNVRLLGDSREDAATDALTGLGNRRRLDAALTGLAGERRVLILFDLDGFKTYNDTFGHPAGDRLLAMIGDALAGAVGGSGTAFRMGGDEFCAIVDAGDESADDVARRLGSALVQSGQGFHVGASYGTVLLPDEATDSQEALRIADRRLYANKRGGRISAHRQSSDVLLAVLAERDPDLGAHVNHVADLAGEVARRFGLDDGEVEDIRRAAALHDIGKIAVPERILDKPAALDPDELALMRQHTVVGERVLSAAPALGAVARMVRSSHERWDGAGYPDGLAGAGIPLGARVIFVCDAFDAMTADRPYQAAMTPADALAELRRCAGTQFDPDVVEAFIATLNESGARMAMAGDHAG